MSTFRYTAVSATGKTVKGIQEADSSRSVRQSLREQGFMPVDVLSVNDKSNEPEVSWLAKRLGKASLSAYDLALFTRQLSVLVASSIPLDEALASIARQTEKKRASELYLEARSKLMSGFSLADALAQVGDFPHLYIATIRAGERSGHLDYILAQLSDYTEERHALQQKVKTAMTYPIILLIVSVVIVLGLMTFIVPKIVESVVDAGQALPIITVVIMAISEFLVSYWMGLLLLLAAGVWALRSYVRTDSGRAIKDALMLRLPIVNRLVRGVNTARVASTLSILSRAGVPLVDAIRITAEVVDNVVLKQVLVNAAQKVMEGGSLSAHLESAGQFPPMMVQMIKSGEHSGELEDMLARAAQMQSREVTNMVSALLALLEPIMLVIMGLVVFVIMLAVMLPILNMNDIA